MGEVLVTWTDEQKFYPYGEDPLSKSPKEKAWLSWKKTGLLEENLVPTSNCSLENCTSIEASARPGTEADEADTC